MPTAQRPFAMGRHRVLGSHQLNDQFLPPRHVVMDTANSAADYRATALLSNHSEFDNAWLKAHSAADRAVGEPNPFEIGADGVARYFSVVGYCVEAAKLRATGQ